MSGFQLPPLSSSAGAQSLQGPRAPEKAKDAASGAVHTESFVSSGAATPIVAGLVANLMQADPSLTPADVKPILGATGVVTVQAAAPKAAQLPPAPSTIVGNATGGGLADLRAGQTDKSEHSSQLDGFLARLAGTKPIATIQATDVKWDKGAEVVSNAQKFVIPVPKCEGEALVYPQTYPEGAVDKDGHSIAGQPTRDKDGNPLAFPDGKPKPIVDWQGQPIGDKGLVFFNRKDQSFQAVKSDGEGVVIMNQVNEAQGKKLQDKVTELTGGDPSKLSLDQFKEVLNYATSPDVGWEKPDMYNSDRGFISKKMNPLESQTTGVPQYGLFRRDDRDVCRALLAEGPSEFEAPTTGGITVKQPIPEEGGVLVRQPDGKVWLYRKVDIEAMEETYTNKDGSRLHVSELPKHEV